ncbi:MAG: aminoacyl-tRNA hydrolase [Candidatus Absconditabacterales bacterium]
MKLIAGLGNPGKEYEKTKHNIGFTILDNFLEYQKLGKLVYNNKWKSEILESNYLGTKIIFVKPMEFINCSGVPISQISNFYKIDPKDILVIHDDIDLPVGKIQLKLGGSSAGHNGLKDIIQKIGSAEFWRIRIGVDRPVHQKDVVDYVLSKFKKEEIEVIENKFEEIEKYVQEFLEK